MKKLSVAFSKFEEKKLDEKFKKKWRVKKNYKKIKLKKLKLCNHRVVSFSLNYIFTKFENKSLKNGGLVGKWKSSKNERIAVTFYLSKKSKIWHEQKCLKIKFHFGWKNLIKIGA